MKLVNDDDDMVTIKMGQLTKLQRRYDAVSLKLRNERLSRALEYIERYLNDDKESVDELGEAIALITSVLKEEEDASKR